MKTIANFKIKMYNIDKYIYPAVSHYDIHRFSTCVPRPVHTCIGKKKPCFPMDIDVFHVMNMIYDDR